MEYNVLTHIWNLSVQAEISKCRRLPLRGGYSVQTTGLWKRETTLQELYNKICSYLKYFKIVSLENNHP